MRQNGIQGSVNVGHYRERAIEGTLKGILEELPAVLMVGPRAVGKTTTSARYAATTVPLDQRGVAAAFHADPDAALRGLPEPVLLDEWQIVPEVLGAVKRAVDREPRPGRFILTGSVRADLDAETWAGTGRLVRLAMGPMTVAERVGGLNPRPWLDRLVSTDGERIGDALQVTDPAPDLRDYIDLALQGGFPQLAVPQTSWEARRRWLESYVDQLITRDALFVEEGRDPARLRRYFEAYALNTAGIVEDKTLHEMAGINRKTAMAYEKLLAALMVIEAIPAWSSNRLKRLIRAPKRYVVDPAFVVGALRIDSDAVLRDGDLLGRLLDTFVAAQLRPEVTIATSRPRLYHLRQQQGRQEVDLLAELGGRRVIAIEVKADASPGADAARHLAWLRDKIGERFVAGIVLHTGPRFFRLDRRIWAAPICTLWG